MQFDELYENWIKPTNKFTLEDMLKAKGWRYLSSGCFGSVYAHPKKKYILKVYGDKGYRSFLDFLESEQGNPNVVMIKRHIYKSENFTSPSSMNAEVVALEELKPLPYDSLWAKLLAAMWSALNRFDDDLKTMDRDAIIEAIRKSIQAKVDYYKPYENDESEYYRQHIKDYSRLVSALDIALKRYRNFVETLIRLKEYVVEHNLPVRFDLHNGNFMVRPSTGHIVITDPLANGN
jgi:hypothetical protein